MKFHWMNVRREGNEVIGASYRADLIRKENVRPASAAGNLARAEKERTATGCWPKEAQASSVVHS